MKQGSLRGTTIMKKVLGLLLVLLFICSMISISCAEDNTTAYFDTPEDYSISQTLPGTVVSQDPPIEPTFTFSNDGRYESVSETGVQKGGYSIYSNNLNQIFAVGCELVDMDGTVLARHDEPGYLIEDHLYHYFRINENPETSDLTYKVKPGAEYKFRVYVIYNGQRYYWNWETIKIPGTRVYVYHFHPNGASGSYPDKTSSNDSITLPANTINRSGYRFVGWNSSPDASGMYLGQAGETVYAPDETTFYAIWESIADTALTETTVISGDARTMFTAKTGVNVRSKMNTKSAAVERIQAQGTVVTILGEGTDKKGTLWYHVQLANGETGYIRGDLLATNADLTTVMDIDRGDFHTYSVQLVKGKDCPAYSGPGTEYVRGAKGKAYMSTYDTVYVYGRENNWLLVQYDITPSHYRFGYILSDAVTDASQVGELHFSRQEAVISRKTAITDDPLHTHSKLSVVPANSTVCILARMNEWVYIEYLNVRGFVPADRVQAK